MAIVNAVPVLIFQSTPSVWRETWAAFRARVQAYLFQSTPSVWRETCRLQPHCLWQLYFNPLPPCGGRPSALMDNFGVSAISIHSLRVEGDQANLLPMLASMEDISIHSLRVEGDPESWLLSKDQTISIHSLRVEGDVTLFVSNNPDALFQSTPSVWRETIRDRSNSWKWSISIHSLRVEGDPPEVRLLGVFVISIHSLRVEGDCPVAFFAGIAYDFNPLPPCGGRQQNCTAFRLKLSRANAILTKKNTDTLLHVRKNTFFLIFSRKSGCESLLLFLCA